MKVEIKYSGLKAGELAGNGQAVEAAMDCLWSGELAMTGWVKLPLETDWGAMEELLLSAADARNRCDLFVVLGIGGSSLGAKAVLAALGNPEISNPQVIFGGDSLDASDLLRVAGRIRKEETCLCVISKSGTTVETLTAFSILKEIMKEKYGKGASRRIFAVTDREKGILREEADREGYQTFAVPDDIGGRYSVLSPVGLLPLAVAGIDVKALLLGAESMARDPGWDGELTQYALARYCLGQSGKCIEAFESFDPSMEIFGQWLKQLFGESEGKEKKGVYPTVLNFTRDLHSVGQFLQEGTPMVFETMLLFEESSADVTIPESAGDLLGGLRVSQVNDCVIRGVMAAHSKAGIPILTVTLPCKNAFQMGRLIYFFELSCGISALLLGVNPFDQPGVERYKEESREELRRLKAPGEKPAE